MFYVDNKNTVCIPNIIIYFEFVNMYKFTTMFILLQIPLYYSYNVIYHTDISTMDMKLSFGNFLTKIYYNIFLYLPNLFLLVC